MFMNYVVRLNAFINATGRTLQCLLGILSSLSITQTDLSCPCILQKSFHYTEMIRSYFLLLFSLKGGRSSEVYELLYAIDLIVSTAKILFLTQEFYFRADPCGGFHHEGWLTLKLAVQVIIEGFKSYKEQVATEPFSSRHNCVGMLQKIMSWKQSCYWSCFLFHHHPVLNDMLVCSSWLKTGTLSPYNARGQSGATTKT